MAAKQSEAVAISIPRPDIRTLEVPIIGDTRLVFHRWSQKMRQEMLDKQMGRARKRKEPKNPQQDYEGSLYRQVDGDWYGMPATAFKKAAVAACRFTEGLTMVMARGVIFVEPDGVDADGIELVRIDGDGPHSREDIVRIAMGKADIRYRGEFRTWRALVRVRYNANVITDEQLMNLFALAGLHVGIGEGRPGAPKNTMDWGQFHLATAEEVRAVA